MNNMDLFNKNLLLKTYRNILLLRGEVATIVYKENFQLVLHKERLYSNECQGMYQHRVFLVF